MKRSKAAVFGLSKWPGGKSFLVALPCYAAWVFFAGFAVSAGASTGADQVELLEVEKAFPVDARLLDGKTVELRYSIASGYYMYRDRFRFAINGKPVQMDKQSWPAGLMKQDATFGNVTTYRKSVRLLVPISPAIQAQMVSSTQPITLLATSQGCADAGVCYPPSHQTMILTVGSSSWIEPHAMAESRFSHNRSKARTLDSFTHGK
jgi:thiol:disulfide interchange protein DsbD